MLTRDDYKATLKAHSSELDIARYLELQDELIAHDAEQRQMIEGLKSNIDSLKHREQAAIESLKGMGFSAEVAAGYNLTQLLASVATKLVEQASRLRELEALFERHSDREKAVAEIVFQEIKHGDAEHQKWLRSALVDVLCREDTKSCITFDEMQTKLTAQAARIEELEAELDRLREEA